MTGGRFGHGDRGATDPASAGASAPTAPEATPDPGRAAASDPAPDALGDAVGAQVADAVGAEVDAAVGAQVDAAVGAEVAAAGFHHLGDQTRARGWRITLVTATFEGPDGQRFTRDVVRHPGAVAVVAVTERRTAVLVRQYRGAVDEVVLEIPAGTRDVPGEPAEQTARRELAEEVGLVASSVVSLGRLYNSPGFCDERTELFLATGLTPCPLDRHGPEEEAMVVEELALDDVPDAIADGRIVDAQTQVGLLLARQVVGVGAG